MILTSWREKIKRLSGGGVYTILVIVFVGFASFGLGRLSKIESLRPQVDISDAFPPTVAGVEALTAEGEEILPVSPTETVRTFVGSRNGSKYHYPWCPGAQQIKEENKVWFATREEAERFGYTPAANCKGL